MTERPYKPIDGGFHSELELRALRGQPCQIEWVDEAGQLHQRLCRIQDIYTRERQEFLLLPDGTEVRLDMLRSVDGLTPPPPTEPCST